MKKKFSLLFLATWALLLCTLSCSDSKEEQDRLSAVDLMVDNSSVTLLQGDEVMVTIVSGNGDYYVKPFDESIATATLSGDKVTVKAVANSDLGDDEVAETTILIIDGRKKVARIQVRVARVWDLTLDTPAEGEDVLRLFIGAKRTVKILTGNGGYQLSIAEGGDSYIDCSQVSGQVFTVTAKSEGETSVTVTDKKGRVVLIPIKIEIVSLEVDKTELTFEEPDAEVQYVNIKQGNGGYTFSFSEEGVVDAVEKDNVIVFTPRKAGQVVVTVKDQKGDREEITVTVNPYKIKFEGDITSLNIGGFEASAQAVVAKGNGGYQLTWTDDNELYLDKAEFVFENDRTILKVTAKKLGTTTLSIRDNAGQTLELPVIVNPVSANISSDYCFYMDIKDLNARKPELNLTRASQVTYEIIFYPIYTRSMQSFIGLEGVFLLRAEAQDFNPRFEIATKIGTIKDPRFRSTQTILSDRKDGGAKGPGKWYHVAVVYDGTKASTKDAYKMYIDGVEEKLTPAESSYEDCTPDASFDLTKMNADPGLMIGRSFNSELRLGYCYVYQARVWRTARTAEQIRDNMCELKEDSFRPEELIGYWMFASGVETDAFKDLSGNDMAAQVYSHGGDFKPATFPADSYKPVECPDHIK